MSEYTGWLVEMTLVEDGRVSRVAAGHDYSCATLLGSR